MPPIQRTESEYIYSSQVSFSDYSSKPYSNTVIELPYKKRNLIKKTTLSDDIIGYVDEIDFKFQLDINKMKIGQKYIFDYHDAKYMAIKNKQEELELSEISLENE